MLDALPLVADDDESVANPVPVVYAASGAGLIGYLRELTGTLGECRAELGGVTLNFPMTSTLMT